MNKSITVFEFGSISLNSLREVLNEKIARTAFKQLKSFILPTSDGSEEIEQFNEYGELKDASVCMTLGTRNREEVIRVKNYVGTISLPCGITIEVLPKISENMAENESRRLVVEMLKACSDLWYKSFQNASLSVENLNFFEVYITLFLNEVKTLYKKGLRAGYVAYEDNEKFLKGKLSFSEHIKRNFAHKEKFYVQYDLFSFDRAENRLIKTALRYLLNKSTNKKNKSDIRKYLLLFDEISLSENIKSDFDKCGTGREVKDYNKAIKLCRVILRKKSFTMYSGDSDVIALMFPMETLFEKYIADKMSKAIKKDWALFPQSKGKYLFNRNHFSLRPDILLKNMSQTDNNGHKLKIVIDTKWKRIVPDSSKHYGISQADMYQMYAYHTRLTNVREVVLLYPYYEEIKNLKELEYVISEMNIHIYIAFFDLAKYQVEKNFRNCIVGINSKSELLSLMEVK